MSGRVPQKLWLGTRWGARGDAEETVDGQLVYLIGREGLLDPDLLRRDHSAVGAEVAVDVLDLVQTIDKRIGAAGRVVAGEPPAATLEQEAVVLSGGGEPIPITIDFRRFFDDPAGIYTYLVQEPLPPRVTHAPGAHQALWTPQYGDPEATLTLTAAHPADAARATTVQVTLRGLLAPRPVFRPLSSANLAAALLAAGAAGVDLRQHFTDLSGLGLAFAAELTRESTVIPSDPSHWQLLADGHTLAYQPSHRLGTFRLSVSAHPVGHPGSQTTASVDLEEPPAPVPAYTAPIDLRGDEPATIDLRLHFSLDDEELTYALPAPLAGFLVDGHQLHYAPQYRDAVAVARLVATSPRYQTTVAVDIAVAEPAPPLPTWSPYHTIAAAVDLVPDTFNYDLAVPALEHPLDALVSSPHGAAHTFTVVSAFAEDDLDAARVLVNVQNQLLYAHRFRDALVRVTVRATNPWGGWADAELLIHEPAPPRPALLPGSAAAVAPVADGVVDIDLARVFSTEADVFEYAWVDPAWGSAALLDPAGSVLRVTRADVAVLQATIQVSATYTRFDVSTTAAILVTFD